MCIRDRFLILGMLALTFGLTAIFAALMEGGSIPEEKTGLLAAITVGAVSLAACAILAARAQEKKLLRGILGAAIYACLLYTSKNQKEDHRCRCMDAVYTEARNIVSQKDLPIDLL